MQRYLHPTLTLTLADEAATARLAKALATLSCAGDLIRLEGLMGAGKTTFTQHYLAGLGWQGAVPSPTYTLLQTYATARFNVAHVDCYRLSSPAELAPLGLEAYRQFGIVLAEWAEKGGDALRADQPDLLHYHINSIENPGVLTLKLAGEGNGPRTATLTASPSWQRRLSVLETLGVPVDVPLTRGKSEAGRRAFLEGLGLKGYTLVGQGGDWSGRSYARVTLADGTTRMLMDSPPPVETTTEYVRVAEYYRSIGLQAPQVFGQDEAEGYLLTEDFGAQTLFDAMQNGPQTAWFEVAAEALAVQVKAYEKNGAPDWARSYSRTDFWVEGVRFANWYMPFATGTATSIADYARWQSLLMPLYEVLLETPSGLMQWDCQSPNSMLLGAEPTLQHYGLIDIQDARLAPVGQDVGLLVRNIRTGRHDADEEAVVRVLVRALSLDEAALRRSLCVGAFHHMVRILGGLVRLAVRDSRPAPAKAYLARTWEVAAQCAADPAGRDVLAPIWAFMQPYRAVGLEKLQTLKDAA